MKKVIYPLITVILLLITAGVSHAQFEGKVLYSSYQVNAEGEKQNQDEFTLYLTPERILLQGENRYEVIGNIQTEGVLVRLDAKDFVFLTGDKQVLKISKADILSIMNMLGNNSKSSTPPDVNYKQTGETQRIQGYTCEKFVFTDEDNVNLRSEVWMTKELEINWGMLAESWGSSQKMIAGDLPLNLIFDEGYFPVRVESYRDGKLTGLMEASEITKSSIARAMVQIPSGVKVLSFQDYLFQHMSQQ